MKIVLYYTTMRKVDYFKICCNEKTSTVFIKVNFHHFQNGPHVG